MNKEIKARAYGRVNLIGEHTDYNGGWVLPTSIPQYTEVRVQKNSGDKIIIHSSQNRLQEYNLGQEKVSDSWVDYIQGATKLLNEILALKNQKISGFTAYIESTIPEGSGLSSSAALEMSLLKALKELFSFELDEIEMALLGQRIENEFVGARVGIMDQMATSLARAGEALFLDTLTLKYERIPLPLDDIDILVINSGISHRLSSNDGGYNQRRAECEEACKIMGLKYLRDITIDELQRKQLPDILMRRARHVVTENSRVFAAVKAIRQKNYKSLGEIFCASHQSMRDDYNVSIPEIDILVNLCVKNKKVFGARLTGGGFGGSIVAITKKGQKMEVAEAIIPLYASMTKSIATVLV